MSAQRDDNTDNVKGERKNGAWPVGDKQTQAHVAPDSPPPPAAWDAMCG